MKKLKILSLFLLILLTACGKAENSTNNRSSTSDQNTVSEETITKEGIFAGLADNHTIAVRIHGEEFAIQVGSELQDSIHTIGEGKKVEVQYIKGESGVLELKRIETK